jgi:hypothetical protein
MQISEGSLLNGINHCAIPNQVSTDDPNVHSPFGAEWQNRYDRVFSLLAALGFQNEKFFIFVH